MAVTKRGIHPTGGKPVTQQHMKAESDINNIVSKYMPGGIYARGNPTATREPIFGYFSANSFHDMNNAIIDAKSAFSRLPSRVRGRFRNDPYQLLRFLEDPANKEEAVKLGLVEHVDGKTVQNPVQLDLTALAAALEAAKQPPAVVTPPVGTPKTA